MHNILTNKYSIDILTNRGKVNGINKDSFLYYRLQNNEKFKLGLLNDNPSRVDAHVWFGKKKLGVFRINPFKKLILSHPMFVFRKNSGYTAQWTDDTCNGTKGMVNGLIKVVFKPEAGDCSYGCIQEYDNQFQKMASHMPDQSIITGPKGEYGYVNAQTEDCMFGRQLIDPVIPKTCDNFSAQYSSSLGQSRGDSNDTVYSMMNNGRFKKVPMIKDFDYARMVTLQAGLI
jgi:hypothetical protein